MSASLPEKPVAPPPLPTGGEQAMQPKSVQETPPNSPNDGQIDQSTPIAAQFPPNVAPSQLSPMSQHENVPPNRDGGDVNANPPAQLANTISTSQPAGNRTQNSRKQFDDISKFGNAVLPKISICAYCLTQSTVEIMMGAVNDRRANNSNFSIYQGGIAAAVHAYTTAVTPDLLIVESAQSGQALLDELAGLANVCQEKTRVIVVGVVNDVHLYRLLMSEGVSDYLVPPISPLEVISRIAAIYDDPNHAINGLVNCFYGVRGGTGVSTIAHHVAHAMSSVLELSTTLVDLDLAFGTVGLDFNTEGARGIGEALAEGGEIAPAVLNSMLVEASSNLSLFTSIGDLFGHQDYRAEDWSNLSTNLKKNSPHIVVDLPTSWEPWVRQALLEAENIILCVTPDLVSLRNVKQLMDYFNSVRTQDAKPILVVNQTNVPKRPEVPLKEFEAASGLQVAASIPFDANLFGESSNSGKLIPQLQPKNSVNEVFNLIAGLLTGQEVRSVKRAPESLWAKLLKK